MKEQKPRSDNKEQRTCPSSKCSHQWHPRVERPLRCPRCQTALRKDADYVNPSELRKARKVKLFLAGYTCEDCGATNVKLVVHHLDKKKDDHSLENLRVLCHACHLTNYHTKDHPKGKRYKSISSYVKVADRNKDN